MKKIFTLLTAVVAMLATSCVKDATDDIQVSGAEGLVTFTVEAPEFGSRTLIGNGQKATSLVYAVYDKEWAYLTEGTAEFQNLVANVSLRLVNNKEYNFVFWASVPGNTYYTLDTRTATVEVSYEGEANDENRDAFFGQLKGLVVDGTMNESVKLYRPFAQVNWGTNDVAEAKIGGFDITTAGTAVYEAEAYTSLSLKDGAVDGLTTVTFAANELVSNSYVDENGAAEQLVTKAGASYTWLAMNYLLWTADEGTLTYNKLTIEDNLGQKVVVSYPNANVRRNWRTNLVGSLLTDQTNITVEIVPGFEDQYDVVVPEYRNIVPGVDYDAETNTLYLTSKAGLKWFADQTNLVTRAEVAEGELDTKGGSFEGYTIKLVECVDLENEPWTPIASVVTLKGVFDGCGQTISNLKVDVADNAPAGLFATARVVKNVKLQNVNITSHYKTGAVVGEGICAKIDNCSVDGGTITVTTLNDDNANHVGGIVGYLYADGKESTAWVKDCSVKNLTISAYRDVAAVAGTVGATAVSAGATVSGNAVENVTVVANQLVVYAEQGKAANADELVGRTAGSSSLVAVEANSVAENVEVAVVKDVNDTIEVANAAALACFSDAVRGGNTFEGKNVVLTDDVDLFKGYMDDGDPISTAPIGQRDYITKYAATGHKAFKGTFDGQGHSIKNLYQNGWALGYWSGQYGAVGLFSRVEDATIKNLVIDGCEIIVEGGNVSAIAANAVGNCTFENITLKNTQISSYNNGVGGIVAWSEAGTYNFKNINIDARRNLQLPRVPAVIERLLPDAPQCAPARKRDADDT